MGLDVLRDNDLSMKRIRHLADSEQIMWRSHIILRMQQRGITINNVLECISNGEIIEYYHDDYPFPSCLISGRCGNREGLHLVCALGQGKVWMITAYRPSALAWKEDFKTRRN